MTQNHIAPPSASSGSGTRFEWVVGAFYLLSMLAEGEPRGLPGAQIRSVKFQQRIEGKPLDDIVVEAVNADGSPATIEIQAKLTLDFTASDKQFQDLVIQLWQASQGPTFLSERYELAVAIAKTSTRIEREYQELLHWARQLRSAEIFFSHVNRAGFGSEGGRKFIDVVRTNLRLASLPDDDETVWRLLSRFQILVFDFTAPGSCYEHRARERALSLLSPHEAHRAGDLWSVLIDIASNSATAAGDRLDRPTLVRELNERHGLLVGPKQSVRSLFEKLEEDAGLTLAGIDDTVGGQRLSRSELVQDVLDKLETNRVVHIAGAPGAGKSHILKQLANQAGAEGRIIVLANGRIFAGGWRRMAEAYGCQLSLAQLFNELACGGGVTLFVDNIDQIEGMAERATLMDLFNTALAIPGWSVVTTGSADRDEWRVGLPFGPAEIASVEVGQITDNEAAMLAAANPTLGLILAKGHPAERLARNLFYLARLVELSSGNETIRTELDLARLWWNYAGGRNADAGRLSRKIALRKLAKALIANPHRTSLEVDEFDPVTVTTLLALGALREDIPGATIAFRHDVLRDWAMGFVMNEGDLFAALPKTDLLPVSLARGVEMLISIMLAEDETAAKWLDALRLTRAAGNDASWLRPVLLPLPRSVGAYDRLGAAQSVLLAENGEVLRELLRLMLAIDAEPINKYAARLRPDLPSIKGLSDIVLPKDPSWIALVAWLMANANTLPAQVLPEVTRVIRGWLIYSQGAAIGINELLVGFAFAWLAKIDEGIKPRYFRKGEPVPPPLGVPNIEHTRDALQMTAFAFAHLNSDAAHEYLGATIKQEIRYNDLEPFVKLRGNLAKAAAGAYVDLLIKALIDDERDDDDDDYGSRRPLGPFTLYDNWFSPHSPSQGPFLELLRTDAAQGLRLIRALIGWTMEWRAGGRPETLARLTITLGGCDHEFLGGAGTYHWSRVPIPSSIVTSALMALEAWGHEEIENGATVERVMNDVLGPSGSSVAFLAVAVDLVLSHWNATREWAWPMCACSRLIQYDDGRHLRDVAGVDRLPVDRSKGDAEGVAALEARPSRRARLVNGVAYYARSAPAEIKESFADAVRSEAALVPPPENPDGEELLNGRYAIAQRTLRMIDPASWNIVHGEDTDGNAIELLQFRPSDVEAALIAAKSEEAAAEQEVFSLRIAVQNAFADPSKSTPELVDRALAWARSPQPKTTTANGGDQEFERGWNGRAVVMAAVLAIRQGADHVGEETASWARNALVEAAETPDREFRAAPQIEYNRSAIATMGLVELYNQEPGPGNAGHLLRLAAHEHPAVRNALAKAFPRFAQTAPQLLRALLRLSIVSSLYSTDRNADSAAESVAVDEAIASELSVLINGAPEPDWPALPEWPVSKRRGIRIGRRVDFDDDDEEQDEKGDPSGLRVDEERLGSLASSLVPVTAMAVSDWIVDLAMHLLTWALAANGRGSERNVDNRPVSFNFGFFEFLGVLSVALPASQVVSQIVEPLGTLPDDSFHDAIGEFLQGFDRATLAIDTKRSDDPLAVRLAAITRIESTYNFERTKHDVALSTESHAASAYKALFFLSTNPITAPSAIIPQHWSELIIVMPAITKLLKDAPGSGYLASLFMSLVETSTGRELLPHVIEVAEGWCAKHGTNAAFWLGNSMGGRLVEWLDLALQVDGGKLPMENVKSLQASLAVMARAGVAGIAGLEARISVLV